MYYFDDRVRYSECDENGDLSLVATMNYLQDCSTFQSESLDVGLDYLNAHHMGWVLTEWEIKIDRLPHFCDTIRTKTWSYGIHGFQALRCFAMDSEDGERLVTADSQWVLFDLQERRMMRIPESQMVYLSDEPRCDLPAMPRRLAVEGPFEDASPVTVSEQHLDTNRHVNNAQYVLMAMDALSELGLVANPKTLTVQYRSMALLGDVVRPRVHPREYGSDIELLSQDGSAYAVVRMENR